jgi:uncharacterized alkaline shock family protein YloU
VYNVSVRYGICILYRGGNIMNKKEVGKTEEQIIEEVLDADTNIEIATNLNISEDVIGIIAGLAAAEVDGIAGMTLGFVDGLNQILGSNKKYAKGVKIELEGKKVIVDLFVNVKYGVRIPDVAWSAQNAVKKAVENMTGLEVASVNINVQGIIFDKKESRSDDEE